MNRVGRLTERGYTMVEIIIVIVIIAILASLTLVAYNGAQDRARDAARLEDASTITKALRLYATRNGNFPNEQSASWEYSYDYPNSFIAALTTSGTVNLVPVDKVNTITGGYYRYFLYDAGTNACPVARGNYYVFEIMKPGGGKSPQSPGFSCTGRDWSTEAWYVIGGYQF